MLFIHIGVHKTGTSTIQKFMSENTALLARHGVLYPQTGRANNAHHNLAAELRPKATFFSEKKGGWAAIREEAATNPDKQVVISSEGLHTLPKSAVEALRGRLDGVEVRIICYIRDFVSRWPSTYAERTKSGSNVTDFDSYLRERGESDDGVDGDQEGGDATDLGGFAFWGDSFGWDALRVRSLDSRNLVDGNLLNDFVAAIGLDYSALKPELDVDNSLVRNASPGWKTIELLRELHAASGGRRAAGSKTSFKLTEARKISQRIKRIGLEVGEEQGLNASRGQYLTRDQHEQARSRYAELVEALNAKLVDFQIPLPEPLDLPERPFLPEAAKVPLEERAAFHRAILFELVREYADEGSKRPTKRGAKRAALAQVKAADAVSGLAEPDRNDADAEASPKLTLRPQRAARQARRAARKETKAPPD